MEGEGKTRSVKCNHREMEGNACKHAINFLIFYVRQMNIKIMIGQNKLRTLLTAVIGQSNVIQVSCCLSNHTM